MPADAVSARFIRFFLSPLSGPLAYIRSTGQQYIRTDFYPGPLDSAITIDFQMADISTAQQRLFGNKGAMNMQAYINGSLGWSWSYSNGGNWSSSGAFPGVLAAKDRTQVTVDGPNDIYRLVIAGTERYTCKLSTVIKNYPATCSNQSDNPINIMANA